MRVAISENACADGPPDATGIVPPASAVVSAATSSSSRDSASFTSTAAASTMGEDVLGSPVENHASLPRSDALDLIRST